MCKQLRSKQELSCLSIIIIEPTIMNINIIIMSNTIIYAYTYNLVFFFMHNYSYYCNMSQRSYDDRARMRICYEMCRTTTATATTTTASRTDVPSSNWRTHTQTHTINLHTHTHTHTYTQM